MKVAVALLVLVAGLIAFVATRPTHYRVERKIAISGPVGDAFDQVDSFRAWAAWSPWQKLDPAMEKTYGGPARGAGATYAWKGNDEVGQGKMKITESVPGRRIRLDLEFTAPFPGTAQAELAFSAQPSSTEVTWSMEGNRNFMAKLFGIFVSMDSAIGKDLEAGLDQLRTVAEATAQKRYANQVAAAQAEAGRAGAAQAAELAAHAAEHTTEPSTDAGLAAP